MIRQTRQPIFILFAFFFLLILFNSNELSSSPLNRADETVDLKKIGIHPSSPPRGSYNMYSSDEKKLVWFRVFKNASCTTRIFLKKHIEDLTQSRPTQLPKKFNNYFKFAFVRNSWDRLVSCYCHKIVNKEIREFQECFDKDFTFFVKYISKMDLRTANPHIRLQTELVPAEKLDFIGKLDRFVEDFQYVCDQIGVEYTPLTHEHKTEHKHYSHYYTPTTRRLVAKMYKRDIEAFGFKFEKK